MDAETLRAKDGVHLEVREDELMLKNVVLHWLAIAFASSVLPVPGGP